MQDLLIEIALTILAIATVFAMVKKLTRQKLYPFKYRLPDHIESTENGGLKIKDEYIQVLDDILHITDDPRRDYHNDEITKKRILEVINQHKNKDAKKRVMGKW